MFSKVVYSELEFSAPTSRNKVFKLQNFFPEWLFSCACVSLDAITASSSFASSISEFSLQK